MTLPTVGPGVLPVLALVRAELGPGFGQMKPFYPVSLGPAGRVAAGLTERVVCDPTIRRDARALSNRGQSDTSEQFDATSAVVVRYRVLGVTMSQTVSIAEPILVVLPYRVCK